MAPARHVPHPRRYRAMKDMNGSGSTVLLVEADADERDRFSAWLEDEGFDLLICARLH